MERPKIGIICPNKEIADIANEVFALSNESVMVATSTGEIDEAIPIALDMVNKGIEVIIARSITAIKLKTSVNIPVIDMGMKVIDILKAVKKASVYGRRVGVIVYEDVIFNPGTIEELLGVDVVPIIFNSGDSIEDKDKKIRNKLDDIDVGVGASITLEILKRYGVKGIFIETERESISQCLAEAKNIIEITNLERRRIQELSTVVNYSYDGIIMVDEKGLIKQFNWLAEKVFKKQTADIVGKHAVKSLPRINFTDVISSGKPRIDEVITIADNTIIANTVPIKTGNSIDGAIFLFQEVSKIQRMEEKVRIKLYEKGYVAKHNFSDIITGCSLMNDIIHTASIYARTNSTIIIMGETGTGKEIIAQSIHNASARADMPFIAINCAALPDNLLESELFGYEEGAFTGARKGGKAGLFESAHRGTIFLDEVGEISEKVQRELLRVLEEKQVMRVGGDRLIPVDVRVICATNKNLKEEVKNKNYREDLYYRLNVLTIKIPPLRQRRESIPLFIDSFLKKFCTNNDTKVKFISKRAVEYLVDYDWPGNVRELENYIERMVVSINKDTIDIEDIMAYIDGENEIEDAAGSIINVNIARDLEQIEIDILKGALKLTEGDHTKAAKLLNISRTTLWRKLNKN